VSNLEVQRFEPVMLELGPATITDHGKRWLELRYDENERFNSTLKDIAVLAISEHWEWPRIQRTLDQEGVPQAVSGIGQATMQKVLDHINGKTSFTMPGTVAMALCTAAPASTATGATISEATGYTGYGRQTIAGTAWTAATAATPSVSANNATITFAACTAGTATLLGFAVCDSATTGAGAMLWFGPLASTVISTTQTPPTVAAAALSLSLNVV